MRNLHPSLVTVKTVNAIDDIVLDTKSGDELTHIEAIYVSTIRWEQTFEEQEQKTINYRCNRFEQEFEGIFNFNPTW